MCGFVSILTNKPLDFNKNEYNNMTETIEHRGPDEHGVWFDENIYLGFKRLSIIDLEHGQQPLSYDDGNYHIVFNGEIYNYKELKQELITKGKVFNTGSDTEVIVALYKEYGPKAVDYLRGMFAFVIWDKNEKEIFGARDPFGIKPFYFMEIDDVLYCASEKKSLMLVDDFMPEINKEALHHFFSFQYVPDPSTLINNIEILRPGHTITKKVGQKRIIKEYAPLQFNPINSDTNSRLKKIRETLKDSVTMHMRSDVPVGTFLSGGVDSTIVTALAKDLNPNIKTFTVGFNNEGFSEIDLAKETADYLGITNISKVISVEEVINELPKIIWHMDTPVADPAAIPLYFVAREASKHVKVVLSGEGADELFGGYNIYREPYSLRLFSYIPTFLKGFLKTASMLLPEGTKGKSFIYRGCTPMEERYVGNALIFGEKEKHLYLRNFNKYIRPTLITSPLFKKAENYDPVTKMQYIDMLTWLRGDILVKADRMTMAHSIETRVPFLDKEVMKIAAQLTYEEKINKGTTKYALREAFKDVIPQNAKNRKKLGFPVPTRQWLKNELYDWAKTIILESEAHEFINKENVLKILELHRKGPLDYSRRIWTIITFIIWHQVFIEKKYNFIEDHITYEVEKIS